MIFDAYRRWRNASEEAAAKRAEHERLFEDFLAETAPLTPKASKHPEAALLRHAWKRACVLEILYQHNVEKDEEYKKLAALYAEFKKISTEKYYKVAPPGPFGQKRLEMEKHAARRLLDFEAERLSNAPEKYVKVRPLACIYVGICDQGHVYVGQTVGAPESRWVQHRLSSTGPFKRGEIYVEWKVAEGQIDLALLNERESYYIGFHDAYESGYNETRGNDLKAYERGRAARFANEGRGGNPITSMARSDADSEH